MERNGLSPFELLLVAGAGVVGIVGGAVWLGAWLAAAVAGSHLHASFVDAVAATSRLPTRLSNPRLAWAPEQQQALPGPGTYWLATTLVLVLAVAAIAVAV